MKKVLLVATVQSHICQFHKPLVKMLHDHGCEVHVAARNNLAVKNGLKLDFVDKVFDVPFERSPLSRKNIKAYKQLKQIIESEHYDVVHTNTPVGGVAGRLAARNARRNGCQVIYTAHGFHLFQGGPKKNWLVYYPIEKLMCRYTDELITITEEDYLLAQKDFSVSASRIHSIGANTAKYFVPSQNEIVSLRSELGISSAKNIIICTGELNANKNQITLIHAMKKVVSQNPDTLLLLAGNGPNQENLQSAITSNGLDPYITMLGYRTDLERFVRASDVVVSCSFREGMPMNIIEGMLCQKPVIASINRGHKELVHDGENGFLLEALDEDGFTDRILQLLNDSELRQRMGCTGRASVQEYVDSSVYTELEEIYRKRKIL
jgi:glycosyltransferase EpsD